MVSPPARLRQALGKIKPLRARLTRSIARVPWFGASRKGVPRRKQNFRLLRDVVGSIIIVLVVLGVLLAASGGAWPPVVVVESGSMMHPTSETPYGRIGTIDVGDILFVRTMKDPLHDVHTWAQGGEMHYGRPGDVLIYAQDGNHINTSIIHRAIAFVEVRRAPNITTQYVVHWTDDQELVFGSAGIYLPALGFDEGSPLFFTPQDGYRPQYSGYLTKGDNSFTNPGADQAIGVSQLVDPSWVQGTVHGEVPWMGLGKLALQSGQTNPEFPGWPRVGNAFAPLELWSMFFTTMGVIVIIPLAWDTIKLVREQKRRQAEARAVEEDSRRRESNTVAFEAIPE
ncbi:MAG: S26 family signal peptidase [Candidatus Thermoplasmatota archaeon]